MKLGPRVNGRALVGTSAKPGTAAKPIITKDDVVKGADPGPSGVKRRKTSAAAIRPHRVTIRTRLVNTPRAPKSANKKEAVATEGGAHVAVSKETVRPIIHLRHPTTKKKTEPPMQRKTDIRQCNLCANDLPSEAFPTAEEKLTVNCTHENHTCRLCLRSYVDSELEQNGPEDFPCFTCGNYIELSDLKLHAAPATYERIEKQLDRLKKAKIPNYHFCQAPTCEAGKIHKTSTEPFTCDKCTAVSCVECGGLWHTGRTCEEHQAYLDKRPEEIQAQEKLAALDFKLCPGQDCAARIEKVDGCDHMTCSRCDTDFCWSCLMTDDNHEKSCPYS